MVENLLQVEDGSKLHMTCFLVDNTPRYEDNLCFSELWCVIMICATQHFRLRLAQRPVSIVPVSHT